MAKIQQRQSQDNLCAASQNCYTPLPHDIVVFVIFTQYLRLHR